MVTNGKRFFKGVKKFGVKVGKRTVGAVKAVDKGLRKLDERKLEIKRARLKRLKQDIAIQREEQKLGALRAKQGRIPSVISGSGLGLGLNQELGGGNIGFDNGTGQVRRVKVKKKQKPKKSRKKTKKKKRR